MVTSNLAPAQPDENAPRAPWKLFTDYYVLAIVVLLALFVAAAFFLFQPRILAIKETNAQTQSTLESIIAQRRYLASLEQSVAAAQSIPPDALARVSESLPYQVDQPALIMQLSSAAAQKGIQISSISFSPPHPVVTPVPGAAGAAQAGSVQVVGIQLAVNAQSYLAMKQFLADLETSLQLMDITTLTAGTSGDGTTSYALQLQTYIYSTSTSAAAR